MMSRRFACSRYRGALEAFLDRRELGPSTAAALAHVETCRSCAAEAERTALTIVALRRLAAEASMAVAEELDDPARTIEGAPAGWAVLRARVDRARAPRWRWRTQLAGMLVGASIAAAVAAPSSLVGGGSLLTEAGPDRSAAIGPVIDDVSADAKAEAEWIKAMTRARKESQPATTTVDTRPNPAILAEDLGRVARPVPSRPAWTAR
jgi:hypothetical protein